MEGEIVNRVENSGLVQIDLEHWYPSGKRLGVDLALWLDQGIVLREKPFREALAQVDASAFLGAHVHVFCSTNALIPTWAWMLAASTLAPLAQTVVVGSRENLEEALFQSFFEGHDFAAYEGKRLVVKGCSKYTIPASVYAAFLLRARPFAKSIMFGEPCSTVPLFKA